jgi:hypothetical protein
MATPGSPRLCDALTQAKSAAMSNDVGRSLPWLAGDPDGRGERFDRCQEKLPAKAIFHISARTKYIGQRESTLLVDLEICVEAASQLRKRRRSSAIITIIRAGTLGAT